MHWINDHAIATTLLVLVPWVLRPLLDSFIQVCSSMYQSCCGGSIRDNHRSNVDESHFIGQSNMDRSIYFSLINHNHGSTNKETDKRMRLMVMKEPTINQVAVTTEDENEESTQINVGFDEEASQKSETKAVEPSDNSISTSRKEDDMCILNQNTEEIIWTFEVRRPWPGELPRLSDDEHTIFLVADVDLDIPQVFNEVVRRWKETDKQSHIAFNTGPAFKP